MVAVHLTLCGGNCSYEKTDGLCVTDFSLSSLWACCDQTILYFMEKEPLGWEEGTDCLAPSVGSLCVCISFSKAVSAAGQELGLEVKQK